MNQYGLDPTQLLRHIIRPTLLAIGCHTRSAEALVLGTGMVESALRFVDQIDNANKPGPAFGIFQMEGFTHWDMYGSYLRYHPELRAKVVRFVRDCSPDIPDPGEMVGNLCYATAMCRVRYLPAQPALPAPGDAKALADYHSVYYNRGGKTKVADSIKHFEFAVTIK